MIKPSSAKPFLPPKTSKSDQKALTNSKPQKTCIIGTHGIGKSTLAYRMAYRAKRGCENAIIVSESARESPFPINQAMTLPSALWIIHRHILKELDAEARGYSHIISDRSPLDTLAYCSALDIQVPPSLIDHVTQWMSTYSKIILLIADGPCTLDSRRMDDDRVREEVQDWLIEWCAHTKVPVKKMTSKEALGGTVD